MKSYILAFLLISMGFYAQNKVTSPSTFKGEHFALYNKCKAAVTFCENTQQTYTSCGSSKNCYGLYVLPGDTFYINIEDKNQAEIISADVSFNAYFPAIPSFTFQPIDNNCIPQQPLIIAIPLTATQGSSFEIVVQNLTYVSAPTTTASVPTPYIIYVGGQQPLYTIALSNIITCPIIQDVSVYEINSNKNVISIHPNPTKYKLEISILNFQKAYNFKVFDLQGQLLKSGTLNADQNELLLNDLTSGLYLISIYFENKLIETKKVIITTYDN